MKKTEKRMKQKRRKLKRRLDAKKRRKGLSLGIKSKDIRLYTFRRRMRYHFTVLKNTLRRLRQKRMKRMIKLKKLKGKSVKTTRRKIRNPIIRHMKRILFFHHRFHFKYSIRLQLFQKKITKSCNNVIRLGKMYKKLKKIVYYNKKQYKKLHKRYLFHVFFAGKRFSKKKYFKRLKLERKRFKLIKRIKINQEKFKKQKKEIKKLDISRIKKINLFLELIKNRKKDKQKEMRLMHLYESKRRRSIIRNGPRKKFFGLAKLHGKGKKRMRKPFYEGAVSASLIRGNSFFKNRYIFQRVYWKEHRPMFYSKKWKKRLPSRRIPRTRPYIIKASAKGIMQNRGRLSKYPFLNSKVIITLPRTLHEQILYD